MTTKRTVEIYKYTEATDAEDAHFYVSRVGEQECNENNKLQPGFYWWYVTDMGFAVIRGPFTTAKMACINALENERKTMLAA